MHALNAHARTKERFYYFHKHRAKLFHLSLNYYQLFVQFLKHVQTDLPNLKLFMTKHDVTFLQNVTVLGRLVRVQLENCPSDIDLS